MRYSGQGSTGFHRTSILYVADKTHTFTSFQPSYRYCCLEQTRLQPRMNFQKLTFTRLSSGIHWALPISDLPFSNMTPQMDVIWSRGWYKAIPPPATVPMEYYNRAGLTGGTINPRQLIECFHLPCVAVGGCVF
jgi:hypothetical protein